VPRDSDTIHGAVRRARDCSAQLGQALLEVPAQSIIASGRRGRLEKIEWDGVHFARKVYHPTSPRRLQWLTRRMPRRLRWDRAFRSWQVMARGLEMGLPLPSPLILDTSGRDAVLVSSWMEGEPVHHWYARSDIGGWELADRHRFARWFGTRLHEVLSTGFTTGDLAPHNVLVSGSPGGPWNFGIVDLDDAQIRPSPSRERIIEMLGQVGHLPPTISSMMRCRALAAFFEEDEGHIVGDRQQTFTEISARVEEHDLRKHRRMTHRGRVDPMAGWGLGDDGLPVPFVGAQLSPEENN